MSDNLFIDIKQYLYNITDLNENTILIDYIPNTVIFDNNTNLKLPKYKFTNIISTNINYYFGYTEKLINYINKYHIKFLLCNIYDSENNKWSNLIIHYYELYSEDYTLQNKLILNKLLDNIKLLYNKINQHYLLSLQKLYDLDINDKSIVEFFESNLNIILFNFFKKIKIFYILSIILSKKKKYYLIYTEDFNNEINKYL
jgi:hypothetical protein